MSHTIEQWSADAVLWRCDVDGPTTYTSDNGQIIVNGCDQREFSADMEAYAESMGSTIASFSPPVGCKLELYARMQGHRTGTVNVGSCDGEGSATIFRRQK